MPSILLDDFNAPNAGWPVAGSTKAFACFVTLRAGGRSRAGFLKPDLHDGHEDVSLVVCLKKSETMHAI